MKKIISVTLMLILFASMSAQEAIVNFKSAVPMPKQMKNKEWSVLSVINDELIIYSFSDGKLNLARLDANANVKQQAEHKNTQYSLMTALTNEQEIAILSYDSKVGGIQCNTYDINSLAPKNEKTLVERRQDVFDSYFLRTSQNGQYIAILTNYVKKNVYHHKLYLLDRQFNMLTSCETLQQPEVKNLAMALEADINVTNDGKVIIASFRTMLNNPRPYNGDKSKLNFGKATYATADYTVQMGVDVINKDGQQHYDIEQPISGLAMRPTMMNINDNHILFGIFVGNAHGSYANGFALTDDYVTLDCDLTAKKAIEKGRLSLPGAPWSCLIMYANKPTRLGNVIKMADGSFIVPSDKNPREPYNRFEINYNREFIWADADGGNLTFGSWGSMTVNKAPRLLGGFSVDGGQSVRFPYAGRYWMIDIPETETGTGILRSCTRDGKMTQTTPANFQNITANSQIVSNGDGKFTVFNSGKVNKEFVFQIGSIEMK